MNTTTIPSRSEEWRDIPGYEGIYQASDLGRIRTCEGKTTQGRYGERRWKQRILHHKGECYRTGYRVTLWKGGKPKDWLVARLVALTFIGPDGGLTVNHIDGNRFNNRPENLEWCTNAENIRKGFETGLYASIQKAVVLTYQDGSERRFASMSDASRSMGRSPGYVSLCMKSGKSGAHGVSWRLV